MHALITAVYTVFILFHILIIMSTYRIITVSGTAARFFLLLCKLILFLYNFGYY